MRLVTKRAFVPKEKYVGIYVPTNEIATFTKEWSGHVFSEQECKELLAGKEIAFQALTKSGKPYRAIGSLNRQVFNENVFWGFTLSTVSIPEEWSGHRFTDEEYDVLQAGGTIVIDGAVCKKSGKTYRCALSFGVINGKKCLVPSVI